MRPTGEKSYVVKYRAGSGRNAPTRRVTLGPGQDAHAGRSPQARQSDTGLGCPRPRSGGAKGRGARAADTRELAELFISEHVEAKRKRATASHYRDILERIVLPELGTRQGEKVTTADLARLHARMKNRPYQANRMLAVVGSLYTFAGKRKLVPAGFNPARGIDKYPEKGRERF